MPLEINGSVRPLLMFILNINSSEMNVHDRRIITGPNLTRLDERICEAATMNFQRYHFQNRLPLPTSVVQNRDDTVIIVNLHRHHGYLFN